MSPVQCKLRGPVCIMWSPWIELIVWQTSCIRVLLYLIDEKRIKVRWKKSFMMKSRVDSGDAEFWTTDVNMTASCCENIPSVRHQHVILIHLGTSCCVPANMFVCCEDWRKVSVCSSLQMFTSVAIIRFCRRSKSSGFISNICFHLVLLHLSFFNICLVPLTSQWKQTSSCQVGRKTIST